MARIEPKIAPLHPSHPHHLSPSTVRRVAVHPLALLKRACIYFWCVVVVAVCVCVLRGERETLHVSSSRMIFVRDVHLCALILCADPNPPQQCASCCFSLAGVHACILFPTQNQNGLPTQEQQSGLDIFAPFYILPLFHPPLAPSPWHHKEGSAKIWFDRRRRH